MRYENHGAADVTIHFGDGATIVLPPGAKLVIEGERITYRPTSSPLADLKTRNEARAFDGTP